MNTTLSSTSGLITEELVNDLPLNGRSFHQLLTLNVGTADYSANVGGAAKRLFTIAGKRPETNRFLINGIDYIGGSPTGQFISPQGLSGEMLGVEAVREFNVLQNTYGAEYGKRAGGQISIVTSSGTNQLHGTAFEYLRNSALDARDYFAATPDVPPFKRNQFGGSLGGPIIRDKMFVFGNYEGFRERLARSRVAVVPSAQARRGLLPCNVIRADTRYRNLDCRDPNAYVPVPDLVPGMLPFVRYWPEANGPEVVREGLATGAALDYGDAARPVQDDFGLARFDYTHSSQDSVSTTFTVQRGPLDDPQGIRNFVRHNNQALHTFGAQQTHVFSPTFLNIATFGYSRAEASAITVPVERFPENLVFLAGAKEKNPGSLQIGPGVLGSAPGGYLNFGNRYYYTGADDVRIIKGRHSLSAGMWFQRIQQDGFGTIADSGGTVQYPTLLAFFQDAPTLFRAAVSPTLLEFRSTEAAWYFQDEIKLRPNLKVRLGLRDEMTTGWNEKNGHASNYLFDPAGVILTHPHIGKSALIENNAIALWQPRVGVVWDPTGSGKWAVRASFGIHNDLQDNLAHRLNANPPFNARLVIERTPLLSIIPLPLETPPPPTCSAESPLRQPDCSIFGPGGIDPIMRTPTIQQWSLEVEREIAPELMVQLSYVGSQSYHISTTLDMNTIRPLRCEDPQGCLSGGTRPAPQRVVVPQGTTYVPPGARPNPFVSSTQGWYYFGTSSYHGGSVSLLKRSRGGLMFKTNYTFSKAIALNTALLSTSGQNDAPTVLDRFNLKLSRGVAAYNLQHQFNTSFSYDLPFGRGQRFGSGVGGWAEKLIGGWQWNGIVHAQSGFPFTPQAGSNRAGNGDVRNPDVPNRNPDFQGPVLLGADGFKKTGRYFDPTAFLLPPTGTFGNVARGAFRGPRFVNVDTSLFKTFALNERWNLQFRTEVFNLLNHTNFEVPNPTVFSGINYSPSAGVITETANPSRQIQLALKLEF